MAEPRPAVHRTILAVDVEGFGDPRRTNQHRMALRYGLYRALRQAFDSAGIPWADCYYEDTGDGILILAPPELPKGSFAESLPHVLARALREHNAAHRAEERIRLRMALHAGEVSYDEHGVTAAAINLTFRLLDAPPLKAALAGSPGVLALIASAWFFDEVIRYTVAADPATYRRVGVTVKETATVGWIALPDHPYPPGETDLATPAAGPGMAPRQLPASTGHFVGRSDELKALTDLREGTAGTAGTVVISAIDGTAGIGKTALALHWAHQVADRFPDGQLYVNLRGFDPAGPPVEPAEAIRGFLDAFEVDPGRIPVSPDAQASLYRSLLAGRRVLVVADNARDSDQVRTLLPGSETCLVVVTSRSQLTSLVAREGARPITLDLLSATEARELLAHHLGLDRVRREPEAVDELIELCARLPLALSIVAARAATQPTFPLVTLLEGLRGAEWRLDELDTGDSTTNVRAAFSWSYQYLDTLAARMFRLLGVHPGPDISLPAAASAAGIPLKQARDALAGLTRAQLLHTHSPGRFALHDLLRSYAAERARSLDSEIDRRSAIHRMLDHYLHTGHAAALLLNPNRNPITVSQPWPGAAPENLQDHEHALAWFQAEYPVLLAAIALAARNGFDSHAWQIPWSLADFFDRRGHWRDWAAIQRTALTAAQCLGDRDAQAHAHRGLGNACARLGSFDDAYIHLSRALDLYGQLGDHVGQARTHRGLTTVFDQEARHSEALDHAQQALDLYRAADHRAGQAAALNDIGWLHAHLRDNDELSLTCCQQALSLFRELGDPLGEASAWDSLGYACHQVSDHPRAIECYQRSLHLWREQADQYNESGTLTRLGDTHQAVGDVVAARTAWQQALAILDDLHHADADLVRAKLAEC